MLPENDSELQSLIESYRAAGIDPVPLSPGAKSPDLAGWSKRESFSWEAFRGHNIGCRGTDVLPIDFDDPVAADIALRMFDLVFDSQGGAVYDGRSSKPVSHLFVRLVDASTGEITRRPGKGAASPFKGKAKWAPPVGVDSGGAYLFELQHHRGLQAMIPPSVHSSGETLCWYVRDRAVSAIRVPVISADELLELLRCVWLVRALVPLWVEGHRHDLALWAGTWLYSARVEECWAKLIIDGVLHQSGDDDPARAGQFLADWGAVEPTAVRRGIGGVREVVGKVLGESSVEDWFLRLGKYWPALRSGSTAAAVFDAAKDFASSTPHSGTVSDADTELELMLANCTLITAAGGDGRVHDLRALGEPVSLRSYKQAMGRVGWSAQGPRGGVVFTHVVDAWVERVGKRVARGTAYLPGHRYGVIVDEVVNTFQRSPVWNAVYLRWRGETLQDVPDSSVAWWLSWVTRVVPDGGERAWLHRWIAHLLVHPERLPGWALYLMTPVEGVGRTSIARVLSAIMGPENCRPISMAEMKSGYTNWAADSVFRYANEVRESGASRGLVVAQLQDAISDPEMGVTRKYAPSMRIRNFGGYMLISNSFSDLHLRGNSRRYCCIANGTVPPTQAECAAFFPHLSDPAALEALCEWYFNHWEAHPSLPERAPTTDAFNRAVDASATGSEHTIAELQRVVGNIFTIRQARHWLDGPVFESGSGSRRTEEIRAMLRAAGFESLNRRVLVGEHKDRVYVPSANYGDYVAWSTKRLVQNLAKVNEILGIANDKNN